MNMVEELRFAGWQGVFQVVQRRTSCGKLKEREMGLEGEGGGGGWGGEQ